MVAKQKSPKPLDQKKLLEECDREQSFANRCLYVFVRETQADIDSIAAALPTKDFPEIARLAHRIKGASASIRAEFLREKAEHLEMSASTGTPTGLDDCFALLKAEFERFNGYVAALPLNPE
jgi:HPt (histidine-containing phosphotransfer) domain-containing protein